MDAQLTALQLFLVELGIPPGVTRLTERRLLQKAVYLGQAAGADLGYRHNWYIYGPYSPALTRDYFTLAENVSAGAAAPQDVALHPALREALVSVKPLLETPADLELPPDEWLELLASIHYQACVMRRGTDGALTFLAQHERKSRFEPYFSRAVAELRRFNLLDA